jgi:hypothetical protein
MELDDRITYGRKKNPSIDCSWCGWPNELNESERKRNIICSRCTQPFSLDPEKARKENLRFIKWTGVLTCNTPKAHANKVEDLPAEVWWTNGSIHSLREHRKPLPCTVAGCEGTIRIPKDLPAGAIKEWDGE